MTWMEEWVGGVTVHKNRVRADDRGNVIFNPPVTFSKGGWFALDADTETGDCRVYRGPLGRLLWMLHDPVTKQGRD